MSEEPPGAAGLAGLARRLAGVQAARARDRAAIAAALAACDQAALARYLDERNLLPLLGTRALELAPEACGDALREKVDEAVRITSLRAMLYEHALSTAAGALEDAGVPVLPLKGVALARAAHGSPGLRLTGDTDVLVHRDHVARAIDVLAGLGYQRPTDPAWVDGRPLLHYTLRHASDQAPPLELHWRIHWSDVAFSDALLANSTRRPGAWRAAEPAAELASLLLFYARDGFSGLRLAADIGGWWDRHAGEVPQGAIGRYAAEHPRLRRSFAAALATVQRLVDVPAAALWPGMRLDRSAARAAALADAELTGSRRSTVAKIMAVDLLLSTGTDKVGFLRRYALQPLGEVRSTYGLEGRPSAVVAARGAVHAVGAVVKDAPAVAREILRPAR